MKLRHSPTSPFVREFMAAAAETGDGDRIEIIPTNTRDPNSDLAKDNPLATIPALITDSGEKLYDSAVNCECLDSLHDGAKLLPPGGAARWPALRLQAFGDDIDLGAIAVRSALGYLDFQFPDDDWRSGHPALAAWYAGIAKRPSMVGSAPPERA